MHDAFDVILDVGHRHRICCVNAQSLWMSWAGSER